MTGIFVRALGSDFTRLHPRMQERFSVGVDDGRSCIGRGVMDEVWHGGPAVVPFLRLGATRNLLFPETGRRVPFTIQNHPYLDDHGRETVTFVRTFQLPGRGPGTVRRRRFDATMVLDPEREVVVDYLGTHQHVAADLDLSVDDRGGLCIDIDVMRFHEGRVSARMSPLVCGRASVRERWDDDERCFRVRVEVRHDVVGPVFGYHGRFTTTYADVDTVPADVRPVREEIRV